jgi:hypothetical protein
MPSERSVSWATVWIAHHFALRDWLAWVIAAPKTQYLSGWHRRLKQRTDSKGAIVALARKLLTIIYTTTYAAR